MKVVGLSTRFNNRWSSNWSIFFGIWHHQPLFLTVTAYYVVFFFSTVVFCFPPRNLQEDCFPCLMGITFYHQGPPSHFKISVALVGMVFDKTIILALHISPCRPPGWLKISEDFWRSAGSSHRFYPPQKPNRSLPPKKECSLPTTHHLQALCSFFLGGEVYDAFPFIFLEVFLISMHLTPFWWWTTNIATKGALTVWWWCLVGIRLYGYITIFSKACGDICF